MELGKDPVELESPAEAQHRKNTLPLKLFSIIIGPAFTLKLTWACLYEGFWGKNKDNNIHK